MTLPKAPISIENTDVRLFRRGLPQLFTGFLLILAISARADEFLSFPIDKSGIKVLPQRFEYQLINKDRFRIGDILFDANQLDLQIRPHGKAGYMVFLRWPASLLTTGEVIIKDNIGKAIWQQKLENGKLKIIKSNPEKIAQPDGDEGAPLRTDLALFESASLDLQQLAKIKSVPFFRFCVHREDALTRIYMCSKELFVKRDGKKINFISRDSLRAESFVEINGHMVGNQGTIFLQSELDAISMSAQLGSGASIIIDSRLKNVDFVDVAISEDKSLNIKAKGAEPVNEEQVLSREGDTWSAKLDIDRPTIYLRGEGDIPMRQEFVVDGKVRPSSLQIPLFSTNGEGTYLSSNSVTLKTGPGIELKEMDKKSEITKNSDGSFNWRVSDLDAGKSNRRYVLVNTADGDFVGSSDFYRGLKNELDYNLLFPLAIVDFKFQQALNSHWLWSLGYQQYVQHNALEPNFDVVSAQIIYRLKPGLILSDLSHGIMISADQYNSSSFNMVGFAAGGFLAYPLPKEYKKYFDSFVVNVKLPVAGNGSGYTLAPSFVTDVLFKKQMQNWVWLTGARYETYRFAGTNTEVDFNRLSLILGISQFF